MKTIKSILTIIMVCILIACNTNEKKVVPDAVMRDGFDMTLVSSNEAQMNLIIRNLSGKKFAYAEFTQTQELYNPNYQQLRFSVADTLTMSAMWNSRVIFYELVQDGGQTKLEEKARIMSFGKLFNLY